MLYNKLPALQEALTRLNTSILTSSAATQRRKNASRVCCSATRLVQPVPGRDREINTITHQQASTNTTTQPPKTTCLHRVPFRRLRLWEQGSPSGYLRVICTENPLYKKNTHTLVRDKPERERVCCSATRLVQPVPGSLVRDKPGPLSRVALLSRDD